MSDLGRTPLYDEHVALNARMVPFAGYLMPVQYPSGITEEHRAVRGAAGVFDVSHMGRLDLTGSQASEVVNYLVTGDVNRLQDGQAMYTAACKAEGTILDDLIVYRRSRDSFLVVCNASNRSKIVAHFSAVAKGRCQLVDRTDRTALLALQGPRAFELLGKLGAGSASALGSFFFGPVKVLGIDLTAARTGYTGEDGVELLCRDSDAVALWRALVGTGATPIGLGARDTLRLEARLCLYGNDIDETTTPYEAGIGWIVKLDKGDFLGRDALLTQQKNGTARRLVGFEMVGRGIARHGYPITKAEGGPSIGAVTSGSPSITTGKNIGLGYVPTASSEVGTHLGIDIRGKIVEAVVVKTPFYKRAK